MVAVPFTDPTVAVMVPLPGMFPAVKVVDAPGEGEKVPSAGDTDHAGEMLTALL